MAETDKTKQKEAVAEEESTCLSASFWIDQEQLTSQGRSLQLLLHHRRCASCWGSMVQLPDEGRGIRASEHLKQIARHCSTAAGFIQPEMPLMEAFFRLLLANKAKPMTLKEIYGGLEEQWVETVNPRIPSVEGLYWTLRSDTFYGISQIIP